MIPKGELLALRGEWSLSEEIIEKDYVLGWLLAGIAAEPALATFLIQRHFARIDESRWPWTGYRNRGPTAP